MNTLVSEGLADELVDSDIDGLKKERDRLAAMKQEKPREMGGCKEMVDHPAHYGGKDNPFEVIKVLENWLTPEEFVGFCKGNIHKYLARANDKRQAEDVAKASWYASRLKEFEARGRKPEART